MFSLKHRCAMFQPLHFSESMRSSFKTTAMIAREIAALVAAPPDFPNPEKKTVPRLSVVSPGAPHGFPLHSHNHTRQVGNQCVRLKRKHGKSCLGTMCVFGFEPGPFALESLTDFTRPATRSQVQATDTSIVVRIHKKMGFLTTSVNEASSPRVFAEAQP